ncbi:MAG: anaerobic carbon-monoxide dehydrogenase catalytic subunit [Deltaproteobacteria bacterium]|jgi:carbon-monoxide dehydrogenase catalytic subunit|nr:anaerobic carbon-monoxide dehydrogenase catalytic subunit [Deltaproteobacteria bacterium]
MADQKQFDLEDLKAISEAVSKVGFELINALKTVEGFLGAPTGAGPPKAPLDKAAEPKPEAEKTEEEKLKPEPKKAEEEKPKAAPPKPKPPESGDPITIQMLNLARERGQSTIFDRAQKMKQCNIGTEGICCKVCSQGPCRIPITKAIKEGTEPDTRIGLCGATPETISTRNLIRMISAGSASHSDHGLDLVETLKDFGEGKAPGYQIKDEAKLRSIASNLGLKETEGLTVAELSKVVADALLEEWGRQTGELSYLKLAPKESYDHWTKLGVKPRGINREAVEIMHRTHMGVDQDYRNLIFQGVRCALADGWSASMITTDLQDALYGAPTPSKASLSLGTLSPNKVNIVLTGQYPNLGEKLITLAETPAMINYAKSQGAEGFNIGGVCATAVELQERHALSGVGDYLQQELVLVTGAVEAMVVDAQCAMEALGAICECYHTKLITTLDKARFDPSKNYVQMEFKDENLDEKAEAILKLAADNFKKRGTVTIPEGVSVIEAGHSVESLGRALGSNGSGPLGPLAESIFNGSIKGVAALLGCNNVRVPPGESGEEPHVELARKLIADDILVLTTGCAAMACGRAGLLSIEAAEGAGDKLKAFSKKSDLPPVIHMGSCVDNSRILTALSQLAKSGKIGGLSALPVAVAAPGWTTEQILATCFYFAASGIDVFLGVTFPIQGVPFINNWLGKDFGEIYGGVFRFEPNPVEAAKLISETIGTKRAGLGLA